MGEPAEGFDRALLLLYRNGRWVGTLTFEEDALGGGPPVVKLERDRVDAQGLRLLEHQWGPLLEQPTFRISAGIVTLRLAQDDPATRLR